MIDIELDGGAVALVDDDDADRVVLHRWHVRKAKDRQYAVMYSRGRTIGMHRFIIGDVDGMDIDHINRDGLNNTRSNLRVCTRTQNNANRRRQDNATSTRFKGIYPNSNAIGRWCAQIGVGGKRRYLGIFATEEEAAHAYDKAAREVYGEFARVNFPLPEHAVA